MASRLWALLALTLSGTHAALPSLNLTGLSIFQTPSPPTNAPQKPPPVQTSPPNATQQQADFANALANASANLAAGLQRPSDAEMEAMLSGKPNCAAVKGDYLTYLKGQKAEWDLAAADADMRCKNFAETQAFINSLQLQRPDAPYTLAMNPFSDWTLDQWRTLLGVRNPYLDIKSAIDLRKVDIAKMVNVSNMQPGHKRVPTRDRSRRLEELPDSIDYRFAAANPWGVAAVTSVKTQGSCGACWAFTAAAVLEGQVALAYGSTVSASMQQLIDCVSENNGCLGGRTDLALNFINKKGLTTLQTYPYIRSQTNCHEATIYASAQGPRFLTPCDETQLMEALYYMGPISVYVKAACRSFQNYGSGVLDDDCITGDPDFNMCQQLVDHAVLLVGYGTDARTGLPYWLIKNTWGSSWGEAGYIRIKRGGGSCGTGCVASYPMTAIKAVKGALAAEEPGSNGGDSSTPGGWMIKNKRALVVGLVVASTLLAAAFLYYFCWPSGGSSKPMATEADTEHKFYSPQPSQTPQKPYGGAIARIDV